MAPDVKEHPATRFTVALVVVLVVLVGIQVAGALAVRSVSGAAQHRVALAADVERIRYYDEVLTMSARMAAATGDRVWVDRYEKAAPELDGVIADAFAEVPTAAASRAVTTTDTANTELLALEARSFAALDAGDPTGASAILNSDEYARWKATYRRGMDDAVAQLVVTGEAQQRTALHLEQLSALAGVVVAVLLVLLWAWTAGDLRRSRHAQDRAEAELRRQAHHDSLTGLANRRLFREKLADQLARDDLLPVAAAARVAVLFVDLDHFKEVNDTAGHATGDLLLIEAAARITDVAAVFDGALVARLSGDEFAVMIPDAAAPTRTRIAGELVAALARPYGAAGSIRISASVGVAGTSARWAAGTRDEVGELLREADLAMYDAKTNGRARWSEYAEHMTTELMARVDLERDLHRALARGELVVYYQPIHDLVERRAEAMEALVRWDHPQHGLLGPDAFIPVAESSDLIISIGRLVLETAVRQLVCWRGEQGEFAPAQVAVNVSPRELLQPGYAAQVLSVLAVAQLPARCLVLEVTETTVMTDQGRTIEVLEELRASGVWISIDDFGTGHSSLARLNTLPVDELKIDRSFIVAAAPDSGAAGDSTMIDVLVTLARRQGLQLVAEGIETQAQLNAVLTAGCTHGQGYLLGRPAPPSVTAPSQTADRVGSDSGALAIRSG